MQIEELILVRPRRSKKINAKNTNSMDDAQDPCGRRKDAMEKNPRDHKMAEIHSNVGDVEDPICAEDFHKGKGM